MDVWQTIENMETTANTVVVGWARENAKRFLKSVIDLEAENWDDVNSQTWKIAIHNIVKRLRDSPQMECLINNLRGRIESTYMRIENRAEPIPIYSMKPSIPLGYSGTNTRNMTIDARRPKHHHQLAEDISPQKSIKTRLLAFNMLLNTQLSDIASSDCWGILLKNLMESLCDDDSDIFCMSLKVHAKLLTLSNNVMKEGFLSLIDGLRSHYSRKFNKYLPTLEEGIEFDKSVHLRIVKISHLVLETAKIMPEYWVRMGEESVEEIMTTFLAVISMHTYDTVYSKNIIYPFHVMASIDPQAKWCRWWLHCAFGRNIFMSLQSRVVTLLKSVIDEMFEYLESTAADSKSLRPTNFICKESIKLSVFSHCVNIYCCIATYKNFHSFFPLSCKIRRDAVTVPEILCLLIEYLNNCQALNFIHLKIINNAMVRLVQTKECPLLSLWEVFRVCLIPMEHNINEKMKDIDQRIPWHSISIVEALSKNESGIMFLVEGKSNVEHDIKSPWSSANHIDIVSTYHPVIVIMSYADSLLRHNYSNKKSAISLLGTCAMFFKYYDFCLMYSQIPLVDSAITVFQHLQTQYKDLFHISIKEANVNTEELFKSLIYFLGNVASRAGGVLAIIQHGPTMSELVPYLLDCPVTLWETAHFRRLVSMLTVLKQMEDVMATECRKPINEVLRNLWTALEDQESFIRGIERNVKRAVMQYMNVVHTFTSTLSGTKTFFAEYEGSEETLLESDCNPTSPAELIMIEYSNDPWHKIALLTMQALTRNLDAWLYVEAKFGIEKHILQVQLDNISSSVFEDVSPGENDCIKNIIVDECSLLRHHILFTAHVVSRSREDIPGFNNEVLDDFISNHESTRIANRTKNIDSLDSKTELQNLLEDTEGVMNNTSWLLSARKAFRSMQNVTPSLIITLVEHVASHNSKININLDWVHVLNIVNISISGEETLGIQISVRHGVQIGVLERDLPYDHLLRELIQHTRAILNIENNQHNFKGFDWFLSSVFLLCAGNLEMCQCFLDNFVKLDVSFILWPTLAEAKNAQHTRLLFISLVDFVISKDVPLAAAALEATGVPWGILCYSWLCQCFWTVLEWNQVCEWFTLCVLYPPDVTIYFCAALLHHLQPKILETASDEYTWDQIVHEHFNGFCIADQMTFLDSLMKKHRPVVLPKLLQSIAIP